MSIRPWTVIKRTLVVLVVLMIALILAGPYLAAYQPLRNRVLQAAAPEMNGTITASRASLGWFSSPRYQDVQVRLHDGRPVLNIQSIQPERSLWGLMTHPSNAGTVRLDGLHVDMAVYANGRTNLDELHAARPDRSVLLDLHDVSMSVNLPRAPHPWEFGPIAGEIGVAITQPGSGLHDELVVYPGLRIPRIRITPQMCRDVLAAAGSPVADATRFSGDFTLQLDQWRVPLKDPHGAAGAGRLTIHQLETDLGALVGKLSESLHLPAMVRVPPGTVVNFEVADKQFRYHGVQFTLAGSAGRSQGSVRFDGGLNLSIELVPALDTFAGQLMKQLFQSDKIAIHVRGTVARPEVDFPAASVSLGRKQALP